jgi:type IX secretion system PorP/SprF family membrane protein
LSGNQTINLNYFSLNAGILYSGSITDNDQFYAGVSVYHINRPEKSFEGNGFQSKERFTFHGGGYFPVASGTTLYLSGNWQMQNGASEVIAGGTLGKTLKEDKDQPVNVYAGGWFRVGDAVIPYMGMDISSFRLGFSYDINISGLAQASRRQGGMELSLIYVQRYADKTRRYLPCPTNF